MAEELKEEVLASDLPLSANLHDITVKHFVLDLSCDMAQHMFEGSIVLWCLPSQTSKETGTEKNTKDDSAAVQGLEKTDASVWKSSEISDNLRVCCHTERTVRDEDNVDRRLEMLGRSVDVEADNQASPAPVECVQSSPSVGGCCQVPVKTSKQHRCQMKFTVKEHCLHVFVEGVDSPHQFPQAVQIWYRTDPTGPSLKWTKDQDDQPCVFTPGHFLSNRSLLPSQDFPTALPTCEASITVDAGLTVLLTGDLDPAVSLTDDGRRKFSFFTHFPMPSSTFAIAVGSWEMETLQYGSLLEDVLYKDVHKPPIRLFFPRRLKEKSLSVLGDYLPRCMVEVQRMLGTYPFHRLEVLLVPACFDSLGMASPSLLFLSQSTLGGGGSMCVRVAHELCHTWFGLVMGPQDWTEEWMTEGFCTYLEDVLHAQVTQLGESTEDYLGLRAELHLRVLKAELDNTDENLQSLRPNKGKEALQPSGEETTFLKNGMNAEKKFMQVHYLKGYFLLHALEREVGREPFLSFLRDYVHRYLYQLVTSQEFLQMFFSTFTDLKHISVESINADWLDCPGMPKKPMYMYGVDKEKGVTDKENALSMQIQHQLASIVKICRRPQRKRRHSGQMRRNQQIPELGQMLTPQVVVLLDRLLDEKLVPGHVLDLLRSSYHLHLENPEVCHRWCELVIKHRHKKWHCDVQHFLIQHQQPRLITENGPEKNRH
ncbi:hypothetical protein ACOMHN_003061 [Nucella lapillus]